MKTTLHFKSFVTFLTAAALFGTSFVSKAQNAAELVFQNASLISGTAGNDGAVYRFPMVNNDLDALVTIKGRSSASINLSNIDLPTTGHNKALQPQVRYGSGNVSSANTWWMEFEVVFVTRNTSTPAILNNFKVTALDIDGNGDKLKEFNSFYNPGLYTLENPTNLNVDNLVVSGNTVGKTFTGSIVDHPGIDTSATDIMTTISYSGTNTVKFRVGGVTTGSTGNANRMHSIWFREFNYTNPQILPVKLASFTATLNNNKADLKWVTASEINVSHYVIEKSIDGTNFSDAGLMFAYGSTTDQTNYSFSDNLTTTTATVVYYRLRAVDIDGEMQYSETRIIRLSKQKGPALTVLTYPNPVNNELRVTLPAEWQSKPVVFELFSLNGQVVKRSQTANSSQTETMNLSAIAPGVYVVKVSCEGVLAQQKIIKQ